MISAINQSNTMIRLLMFISGVIGICLSIHVFNNGLIYPSNLYLLHNEKLASDYKFLNMTLSLVTFMVSIAITCSVFKKPANSMILMYVLIAVSVISNICYQQTDYYNSIRKDYFLSNSSNFIKQYPNTDEVKELMVYINNKDFKSIEKLKPNTFVYTNIIDIAAQVKEINDPELTDVYKKYMKDGVINLVEKKDIESLILKKMYAKL